MTPEKTNKAMETRYHYSCHFNTEEDQRFRQLIAFLFQHGEIDKESKYGVVRYGMEICLDCLFDERIIDLRDKLFKYGKIPKNTIRDAFRYIMLYANYVIPEELEKELLQKTQK